MTTDKENRKILEGMFGADGALLVSPEQEYEARFPAFVMEMPQSGERIVGRDAPCVATLRERALDAAVELLGTQGLRALTHARVDERAGLPKGSTSNYCRTRKALLLGVRERLAELDTSAVGATLLPASSEELVEVLCGLLDLTTRDRRVPTTARLVLFMEASHDELLRESMTHDRELVRGSVPARESRLVAAEVEHGQGDQCLG